MQYETMDCCFSRIKSRVMEAVANTDTEQLFGRLSEIEGPVLICGCGGSSVACQFLAKVLTEKNGIVCRAVETRDVLKMNKSGNKSVICISYSGRNIGVDMSFDNDLEKYLLSVNEKEGVTALKYGKSEREESYISLSGTFIPMAMAMLYYTDGDTALLEEILSEEFDYESMDCSGKIYEIMSGEENATAAKTLESTMTEAGLCAAVVHDKYNYCHGRINLNVNQHNRLIYFDGDSDLDRVYKKVLLPMYRQVTFIENRYDDPIVNEFRNSFACIHLCKKLALDKGIDLSSIKECPVNDVFYRFNGTV